MPAHLTFNVDGKSIRLFVQEPPAVHNERRPAIVLLHGAGGNLDFWTARLAPLLAEAGIALYAPHYLDATGIGRADLATIRDGVHAPKWLAVVNAAVRFVATRPGTDPDRIVLAGVSLGGFLALACAAELSASPAASERSRLRAVVSVSGGLVEPYLNLATSHFPSTLILHGEEDAVVSVEYARALNTRLTHLNVAHRTEILPGEGHWFSPIALSRMLLAVSGFLGAHLREPVAERAM